MSATNRMGLRVTTVNWHLTGEEMAYIAGNAEAKAIVADARFAGAVRAAVDATSGSVADRCLLAVGGHIEGFENGFAALYRAVYADVAAGAPSKDAAYATFADGHRQSLLLDAVAESARTERWVKVGR